MLELEISRKEIALQKGEKRLICLYLVSTRDSHIHTIHTIHTIHIPESTETCGMLYTITCDVRHLNTESRELRSGPRYSH